MTQEIIEMARDSGMELYGLGKDRARFVHHLEAFAKLVAEKALSEHAMRETQRLGQEIEQEPVQFKCTVIADVHPNGIPLEQWTPPPQRKPLTHKEIWNAIRPLTQSDAVCMSLVQISMDEYRAIEAAHGIKENT